jgi:hypothetical protein
MPHLRDVSERTCPMDISKLAEHLANMVQRTTQGGINRKTGRRIAAR